MAIVTREVLIAALENVFGSKGMDRGDIEELSDFVLSFFGYEDYVLDNVLTSAERDIFYNLEECGLLNAHREEVNIAKGKAWRVNQWTYNKNNIDKAASNDAPAVPEKNPYDDYFKEIDQNGS
ncbi:MAG: hypothetical protein M1267_00660 [Candidatus Thermoplasmatota archaeon]|jgi:hypothetical protein|nr:hypothetical protein [Candidatus Thermoplasmatota archaeon]MCL5799916.1 hypothetical protein [Candidatus Thermoplasmatota archaeon]